MAMVKIGGISFNPDALDGISEKEFIEINEAHYILIGKGRLEKMKSDYRELKKMFTKKKRGA